jgi:hypothetical protein
MSHNLPIKQLGLGYWCIGLYMAKAQVKLTNPTIRSANLRRAGGAGFYTGLTTSKQLGLHSYATAGVKILDGHGYIDIGTQIDETHQAIERTTET